MKRDFLKAVEAMDCTAVSTFISADPALAQSTDEKGRNLLHILAGMNLKGLHACMTGMSPKKAGTGEYVNLYSVEMQEHIALWLQEFITFLISKGCNVNGRDHSGRTPLHDAAARENDIAAQVLIDRGAQVTIPDNEGSTPLHLAACQWGSGAYICRRLLDAGANINEKNKENLTPLLLAAKYRALSMSSLEIFLAHGVDAAATDSDGRTVLHLAALASIEKMDYRPLLMRVDANIQDRFGRTALHYAGRTFASCHATVFLNGGARPDIQDEEGMTPLHRAVLNDAVSFAEDLLRAGADPHVADLHGFSPASYARKKRMKKITALFHHYPYMEIWMSGASPVEVERRRYIKEIIVILSELGASLKPGRYRNAGLERLRSVKRALLKKAGKALSQELFAALLRRLNELLSSIAKCSPEAQEECYQIRIIRRINNYRETFFDSYRVYSREKRNHILDEGIADLRRDCTPEEVTEILRGDYDDLSPWGCWNVNDEEKARTLWMRVKAMAVLVKSEAPSAAPAEIEECRSLHRRFYCLMEQKYPAEDIEKLIADAMNTRGEKGSD